MNITEDNDLTELINMFKGNVSHKIFGLHEYQYQILKNIYNVLSTKKITTLYYVRNMNDEIISGGLFFKSFDRIIYFFAASNKEGYSCSSQTLLLDCIIKKHSNSNLILDFEGSSVKSIAHFYLGFGSTLLKLNYYRKMCYPFPLNLIK